MRGIWVLALLIACGKDAAPPKPDRALDAAVVKLATTLLPVDHLTVMLDGTWQVTAGAVETELRDPARPGIVVSVTATRTIAAKLAGKELAERHHAGRKLVDQRRRDPVTHAGVTLSAAMITSEDAAGARRYTTYLAIEHGLQVQVVTVMGDDLATYTPVVEQIGKRLTFAITATPVVKSAAPEPAVAPEPAPDPDGERTWYCDVPFACQCDPNDTFCSGTSTGIGTVRAKTEREAKSRFRPSNPCRSSGRASGSVACREGS